MLNLNDKSILITGGTGSFGQAFVRDILANHKDFLIKKPKSFHPENLTLFELLY